MKFNSNKILLMPIRSQVTETRICYINNKAFDGLFGHDIFEKKLKVAMLPNIENNIFIVNMQIAYLEIPQ